MMFSSLASIAKGLAVIAFAAPAVCSEFNLTWHSKNTSLPKVLIFNTGGTIVSTSNYSRVDNIQYGSGPIVTPEELIGNYSEILNLAQLAVIKFPAPGGSAGVNSTLYLNVSQYANKMLCSKGSDIAGVIMFHGTNTLEETAFGVDLTFNCSKPFIATGAMRPNSYISPDGPSNFYQAVAAAASPASRNRGGLIVFNDRISSIYYSTKTNANTPDTFKALEQGNLGVFLAGQPYYYFDPAFPNNRPHFNIANKTELPSVIILFGQQGFDASLMYAAVANGAKGLVIMGSGAAQLSPSAITAAADLFKKGIPTVAVARPVTGTGSPAVTPGATIFAAYLGAEQARIMLQLALGTGYNLTEVRTLFESPLRNAIYGASASQGYYYGRSQGFYDFDS